MREVPLTQGFVALIDDEDADRVAAYSWRYIFSRRQSTPYAMTTERGTRRTIMLHRLILGVPPGVLVDHRNRYGLDCQRHNLRPATASQNAAYAAYAIGRSGFRGVQPPCPAHGERSWVAKISVGNQRRRLGVFPTAELAARAYDAAARLHHGEFAVLNFPGAST